MADPAGLTIDQLRELAALESHLFLPIDAPNETFKVTIQNIIEYARTAINVTPTGSIIMWPGESIPSGYIEVAGQSFDVGVYPVLGALFPLGKLPDTRGMILKHTSNGRSVLSFEAESVKGHTHTAQQESHSHGRGSMEISGEISGRIKSGKGAFLKSSQYNSDLSTGTGVAEVYSFLASRDWTGLTDSVSPKITVNSSGTAKNLVDNIGVKFIVKQE